MCEHTFFERGQTSKTNAPQYVIAGRPARARAAAHHTQRRDHTVLDRGRVPRRMLDRPRPGKAVQVDKLQLDPVLKARWCFNSLKVQSDSAFKPLVSN